MQSSTVSARCESVRSDNERDLTKVDEETFLEDFLLTETFLIALVTFAPSCSSNLIGDKFLSIGNFKEQVLMILFLLLETLPPPSSLPPPPCLRKMVSLSLTSGLKHTLLLFLDIWILNNCRRLLVAPKVVVLNFLCMFSEVKGKREGDGKQRRGEA